GHLEHVVRERAKTDLQMIETEPMAHRDELARALGRHQSGRARDVLDRSLGATSRRDARQDSTRELDRRPRESRTPAHGLRANVAHARVRSVVSGRDVRETRSSARASSIMRCATVSRAHARRAYTVGAPSENLDPPTGRKPRRTSGAGAILTEPR